MSFLTNFDVMFLPPKNRFLKMDLPRSVKEMSKTDFKPQRCVSNTFRGFSFIQEDFALPERPVSS